MEIRQVGLGSVLYRAMICLEIGSQNLGQKLGLGIHVNVTLIYATYLNIVEEQVHPLMATVFPNDSGLFKQDCHTATLIHVRRDLSRRKCDATKRSIESCCSLCHHNLQLNFWKGAHQATA